MKSESFAALAALACLLEGVFVPAAAEAATLCVRPAGGACESSIQAAVNLAAAGDVIRVFPGTYFENVSVPAGRDGLRILGTSRKTAVVDPDHPLPGPAFQVGSNGVEISTLGIRNGRAGGVIVSAGVSGVMIRNLHLLGGSGAAAIRGEPGSVQLRIEGNEIVAAGLSGIELAGGNDGSLVRGNQVSQVDVGVDVVGAGVTISGNRLTAFGGRGIRVTGAQATVADNVLQTGFNTVAGISVTGTNPTVRRNRLTNAGQVFVSCTTCTGGLVALNTIVGSLVGFPPEAKRGMHVTADAEGLVVDGNRVSRADGPAFFVDGQGIRLTRNVALDTGQPDGGEGFLVKGAGAHRLERNEARRVGASGFRVEANDVTLEGNLSLGAGVSGFFVFGAGGTHSGSVLAGNRALDSNAAGFSVTEDAVATVLRGNSASGNRYDFCDDGSGTDVSSGNAFGTTSTVCDVVR